MIYISILISYTMISIFKGNYIYYAIEHFIDFNLYFTKVWFSRDSITLFNKLYWFYVLNRFLLELFDDLEFMLIYSPHSSYTSTDDFHLHIYVYIWTQEHLDLEVMLIYSPHNSYTSIHGYIIMGWKTRIEPWYALQKYILSRLIKSIIRNFKNLIC